MSDTQESGGGFSTPIEDFCRIAWASLHEAGKLTPREHAEAAHRAGGPSVDELERMIIDSRAARARS